MRANHFLNFLAYGLTAGLTGYSILSVTINPEFTDENGTVWTKTILPEIQYAAFGLAIVLVFIILKSIYWKYVFAFVLFVATLGFIQFHSFKTGLTFDLFDVEFQCLFLFILHWALNPELGKSVRKVLQMKEQNETDPKQMSETKISAFTSRHQDKSDKELKSIVSENKLVPEAVEAARRLIKKRKTLHNSG